MVHKCVFKLCQNSKEKSSASFFSFPKDLSLCKIWATKCGMRNIDSYTDADLRKKIRLSKICEEHFENNFILIYMNRKRLKKDAIPSDSLPLKSHLKKEIESNYMHQALQLPSSPKNYILPDNKCRRGFPTFDNGNIIANKEALVPFKKIECRHKESKTSHDASRRSNNKKEDELVITDIIEDDYESSSQGSTKSLVLRDDPCRGVESNASLFESESTMDNERSTSPLFPCKHYVELIEEKATHHQLRRTNELLQLQMEDLMNRLEAIEISLVKTEDTAVDSDIKLEDEEYG